MSQIILQPHFWKPFAPNRVFVGPGLVCSQHKLVFRGQMLKLQCRKWKTIFNISWNICQTWNFKIKYLQIVEHMVAEEYHMFTRTSPEKLAWSIVAGGGRKSIGCNRRSDECQCASIVRRILWALLPVWQIWLGCTLWCSATLVLDVWQISPIITHHISLRNATTPAWEPDNNRTESELTLWYRLIDHNVSDWISIESLSEI